MLSGPGRRTELEGAEYEPTSPFAPGRPAEHEYGYARIASSRSSAPIRSGIDFRPVFLGWLLFGVALGLGVLVGWLIWA